MLNFNAFFKEAVNESAVESFRVQRCTVYYYLEYDTIQVIEHRHENSGIPQDTFLKRHAVMKDKNTETFFSVNDFRIGDYLQFYGRCYQIVVCNPSTRRYLEENRALRKWPGRRAKMGQCRAKMGQCCATCGSPP